MRGLKKIVNGRKEEGGEMWGRKVTGGAVSEGWETSCREARRL